jgi:GalNAc5-diNAcBac-PP-undecaprenol beta-1,3-glucosyltransferase
MQNSESSPDKYTTTVVIITHNRPDYLTMALEGITKQKHSPDEIIIIDDFSNVDYSNVLQKFIELPVQYLKLNEPSGANKARNTGVKLASKDIVLLLDDDDVWKPQYIAAHISCYEKGADAVVTGHQRLGGYVIKINPNFLVTEAELRNGNRFCGMSGFSAKRAVLLEYPLDENLGNAQDWDLYVRVCCAGLDFVNIRDALFFYRMGTPDGITSKLRVMTVNNIDKRLKAAQKHRAWLGEKYYKARVAEQVLSFLPSKKNKLSWIKKCILLIGIRATISSLMLKAIGKKRST